MKEGKKKLVFYVTTILFIIVNAFLIKQDKYYLSLLPAAGLIILFMLFSLRELFFLTIIFVPLSVPLREFVYGLNMDLQLPTEPLIGYMMLVFVLKALLNKRLDFKLLRHPVSISLYVYMVWFLISSISSELPLVSLKFFLNRLWYIVVFYFFASVIFREKNFIFRFPWFYVLPFSVVIVYSLLRLASYGLFDQNVAHWVMEPFYNDHTSYGAAIAFFIPFLVGIILQEKKYTFKNFLILTLVIIFFMGLIFSYTRAAWLSLIGAVGVWGILLFKIKFRTLTIFTTVVALYLAVLFPQIIMQLEQNQQDTSDSFTEHVQSMSNISSDASNVERLNRWKCALRMVKERPIFGWGPGTYQFVYAPFQKSYERTIISTNFGDVGNAHSEYLGSLAEAGIFGFLSFLAIIIVSIITATRVYKKVNDKRLKFYALISFLGLVTYYVHAVLNNFLDIDKIAAPFWCFTAILVVIDLYHSNSREHFN